MHLWNHVPWSSAEAVCTLKIIEHARLRARRVALVSVGLRSIRPNRGIRCGCIKCFVLRKAGGEWKDMTQPIKNESFHCPDLFRQKNDEVTNVTWSLRSSGNREICSEGQRHLLWAHEVLIKLRVSWHAMKFWEAGRIHHGITKNIDHSSQTVVRMALECSCPSTILKTMGQQGADLVRCQLWTISRSI